MKEGRGGGEGEGRKRLQTNPPPGSEQRRAIFFFFLECFAMLGLARWCFFCFFVG